MTTVLQELINILVGGITTFASGFGSGLASLVEAIFLEVTDGTVTGLSEVGGIIAIFAGVSLAIGLSRWVLNFVTSLGARNR